MVNLEVMFKVKCIMRIGEVSKAVGISSSAIRFYERHGLLNTNGISRSKNGYRMYRKQDVEEIHLIIMLKEFGLELSDIKVLLSEESKSCSDLVSSLDKQLEKCRQMEKLISARISSLLVAREGCTTNCKPKNKVRACCA